MGDVPVGVDPGCPAVDFAPVVLVPVALVPVGFDGVPLGRTAVREEVAEGEGDSAAVGDAAGRERPVTVMP
ncbi:hypothetical protein, partial [Kitasatospora cineracea]|uniref:hypothetical protein n=1 Tax=Kitasatospora cineracea TaxID=88074 RepID=UPI0033CFFFAA